MIERIVIPIQLCRENAQLPTYANPTDAGADIYAAVDFTLEPGHTAVIPTGVKVAIPEGYEIQIRPRSGLSLKTGLRVANSPGTIDTGYRDEIGVIMQNVGNMPVEIYTGQRIAQMVLQRVPQIEWDLVNDVSVIGTDRGGGFGSTGK
ncbi:MAG: dUTP diphosphatase [Peptococcales bacterium]|jgi:dUTP pyrophosphatase